MLLEKLLLPGENMSAKEAKGGKDEKEKIKKIKQRRSYSYHDDSFVNRMLLSSADLAVWTVNDQKKLASLDDLYDRSMEFHRNVHSKDTPLTALPDVSMVHGTPDFESSDIVANVVTLSNNKSKNLLQTMHYSQFYSFAHAYLKNPSKSKIDPEYYWIHLKDLNVLDLLMNLFRMHEIIAATFHDLRQHTNFIRNENELFFTNVICCLDGINFRMFKFYLYLRGNVLITYEVELFPNLEEDREEQEKNSSNSSSSNKQNQNPTYSESQPAISKDGGQSDLPSFSVGPLSSISSTTTHTIDPPGPAITATVTARQADKIMQFFFMNIAKLKKKVFELGVFYMVYEISQYFLSQYDSTIEFISSSLMYFNRIVPLNLLHRERMKIQIKLHMLSAGTSLILKALEGTVDTYEKIAEYGEDLIKDGKNDKKKVTKVNFDSNQEQTPEKEEKDQQQQPHDHQHQQQHQQYHYPPSIGYSYASAHEKLHFHLHPGHSLYLVDILNSYHFKLHSVESLHDERMRIESELATMIEMRTTNTNTLLSLVATTFLPLTFYTAVFGMNFMKDGGYTITLFNEGYGPNVFIGMCLGAFTIAVIFFVSAGWLEFGIFASIFKKLNAGKIDDSKKADLDEDDDGIGEALQRAEEEENRRRDEAMMMRASYSTFSNNQASLGGYSHRRGSAGYQQSQMSTSSFVHSPIVVVNNYPQRSLSKESSSKSTSDRKERASLSIVQEGEVEE